MPYKTCSHIKTDGTLCKSPALRRKTLCYFHYRWTKREARLESLGGPLGMENCTGIELPLLESAADIQLAIREVLHAILNCKIDRRRASLILYGLQLAQGNIKRLNHNGLSNTNCVTAYDEPRDESLDDSAQSPSCHPERRPREAQPESKDPLSPTHDPSTPPKAGPSTPLRSGRDDVTVSVVPSDPHSSTVPRSTVPHVRGAEGGANVGSPKCDATTPTASTNTLREHSPGRKSGVSDANKSPSRFSDDTSTLVASALSGNPRSAVQLFKLAENL